MKLFKPVGEECPDCTDGHLVERVNSKTKNTFLGCSEWPDCKYTKAGGENPSLLKSYSYEGDWMNDPYDYAEDDRIDWDWMDGEF